MQDNQWCVYLVEAENGKIYCGITNDLKNRLKKHKEGTGAKFFRSTPPKTLLYVEEQTDKSSSLKREIEIKKLSRADKEQLIENSDFQVVEIVEFLA
ncbi:MAG: GIY-YIG nuclease family protein [Deltaproteobacteria bacterium]|nr:MAG: GIY-YIG nuclease family protein [Deltaproteobacteria bacterium]